MSIVNSIETVRDWLTAEVCPLVKLKLPFYRTSINV